MRKLPKELHDHQTLTFPQGFLWGASTSAHQVEGNNIRSDWWDWEIRHQPPHLRSGVACDQYNRYLEDFDLLQNLNHNAHRLSIEWARIEPEEGKFDIEAIEHYKQVLRALKERKVKVFLTLWHFTLPLWFAKKGGFQNMRSPEYFEKFLKVIVPEIAEFVDFWVTLNEPGVYVIETLVTKDWPAPKTDPFSQIKTYYNLIQTHKRAYHYLHSVTPNTPVGIANNLLSFGSPLKHSIKEQVAVFFSDLITNHLFYFLSGKTHDYIGINYYFHARFSQSSPLIPQVESKNTHDRDVSDLGWELYPEGIYDVLMDQKNKLPIYITECGIASTNDDRRNRFLITYLSEVYRAIQSGANVKGFLYWSLIDNFEWHRGFDPRFGLIEIDYANQKRIVRSSALTYADIIASNGIPHTLMRFVGHTVNAEEVFKKFESDEPKHKD